MTKLLYPLFFLLIASVLGCGGGNADLNDTTAEFSFGSFETSKSIIENSGKNILQVTTNDNNASYFIDEKDDGTLFEIDSRGVLSFKSNPDYENPMDKDKNNIYDITVGARNGKNEIITIMLTITVTNDKSDDKPRFVSANSVTLRENTRLDFNITAKDSRSLGFIYSISGGKDARKFILDSASGKLSFNSFIPDFDNPSDSDKDNRYDIVVKAINDKNLYAEQNITVIITDEIDDPVASRTIFKTGRDDGPVKGLPFGEDRIYEEIEIDGQRALKLGNRVWEDSEHVVDTTLDFDAANDYCAALYYAGYDDWRAPNRHELAEIINYGKKDILIDDIFRYKNAQYFWTSQQRLSNTNDTSKAWSILFSDGEEYDEPKGSSFHIRCVRGEEIKDHDDFTLKDNMVIDNKTGIMWQNAQFTGKRTWEEAIEYCKNLIFEGYSDWRLPNVNELRSIMPNDDDEILFEHLSPVDMDSGHAWSSTEADETHARYNLNFWDEESDRDSLIIMYEEWTKDQNNDMMLNRCIRGGHL